MATPHVPATYTILTLAAARRQLNQLQKTYNPNLQKILAAITSLADNPRPTGGRKLAHRPELRLRFGNYRILYSVDDELRTVTVCAIAHRREVYK
ncbi:MAG TPA: type II toxin-antitoxin system RelE/ParE family toxin [Pyrinomonadaceae bacterium]|nr:type II toxin-antitoxin system RelE/ParE family toxin [Pyrinomonadaceae bacterium]